MPDLDDPVARSLNSRPKYVASATLSDADASWGPVTVLRGDVPAQVAALRQQPGREVQVHGSTTLGRALLGAGLDKHAMLDITVSIEGHPDNVSAALLGGFTLSWFERAGEASTVRATRVLPDPRLRVALAIPDSPLSTSSARRQLPDEIGRAHV